MAKVINVFKVLRNNWKKSIFFSGLAAWGGSYARKQYIEFDLMRSFCEEAQTYGREKMYHLGAPRHVTVLLNPVSNKGQGKKDYEHYAQPLLHLAGLKVSVVVTEAEGQAKDLMEIMGNTDCVLIAGGDGTVHEAITGLLRRADWYEASRRMPIGIVPIGRNNRIAYKLNRKHFDKQKDTKAMILAQSTMSLVRQVCSDVDVVKIEGEVGRPVYFLDRINVGQINGTLAKLDQYWYLGDRMKKYLTFFFQSFKDLSSQWNEKDDIKISYSEPCDGCSKCYDRFVLPTPPAVPDRVETNRKWWHYLIPRTNFKQTDKQQPQQQQPNRPSVDVDKMKQVVNDNCDVQHSIEVKAKNIIIENELDEQHSKLDIVIHPDSLSRSQFLQEGIRISKGGTFTEDGGPYNLIRAKELTIEMPEEEEDYEEDGSLVSLAKSKLDIEETTESTMNMYQTIEHRPNAIRELDFEESPTVVEEESNDQNTSEADDNAKNRDARWISIDNEYFEFQSKLKVSLLPRKVLIYH